MEIHHYESCFLWIWVGILSRVRAFEVNHGSELVIVSSGSAVGASSYRGISIGFSILSSSFGYQGIDLFGFGGSSFGGV